MADAQTKPLEPVTVVHATYTDRLLLVLPFKKGIYVRASQAWQVGQAIFGVEGVEWIRGHHDENSEQVLACRAAQALVR